MNYTSEELNFKRKTSNDLGIEMINLDIIKDAQLDFSKRREYEFKIIETQNKIKENDNYILNAVKNLKDEAEKLKKENLKLQKEILKKEDFEKMIKTVSEKKEELEKEGLNKKEKNILQEEIIELNKKLKTSAKASKKIKDVVKDYDEVAKLHNSFSIKKLTDISTKEIFIEDIPQVKIEKEKEKNEEKLDKNDTKKDEEKIDKNDTKKVEKNTQRYNEIVENDKNDEIVENNINNTTFEKLDDSNIPNKEKENTLGMIELMKEFIERTPIERGLFKNGINKIKFENTLSNMNIEEKFKLFNCLSTAGNVTKYKIDSKYMKMAEKYITKNNEEIWKQLNIYDRNRLANNEVNFNGKYTVKGAEDIFVKIRGNVILNAPKRIRTAEKAKKAALKGDYINSEKNTVLLLTEATKIRDEKFSNYEDRQEQTYDDEKNAASYQSTQEFSSFVKDIKAKVKTEQILGNMATDEQVKTAIKIQNSKTQGKIR